MALHVEGGKATERNRKQRLLKRPDRLVRKGLLGGRLDPIANKRLERPQALVSSCAATGNLHFGPAVRHNPGAVPFMVEANDRIEPADPDIRGQEFGRSGRRKYFERSTQFIPQEKKHTAPEWGKVDFRLCNSSRITGNMGLKGRPGAIFGQGSAVQIKLAIPSFQDLPGICRQIGVSAERMGIGGAIQPNPMPQAVQCLENPCGIGRGLKRAVPEIFPFLDQTPSLSLAR